MIYSRIKQIRDLLNLTQSEFATKTGVARSAISEFENGTREPSKSFLLAIKDLGISIDWLLTGEGNIFINSSKQDCSLPRNNFAPKSKQDCLITGEQTAPNDLTITLSDAVQDLALASTAPKFAELEEKMDGKFSVQEEKLNGLQKRLEDLESAFSSGAKPKADEKVRYRADEVKEAAPPYGADCETDEEETVELPLAENLAAGMPREAFSTGETFSVPAKFLKKRKKYCVAKIKGTSMTDAGIADGAFVLLEMNETPVDDMIVLARYDDQTTLKRLREKEGGSWELHYEDGSGAIIPLKDGEWEVIGWFVRVV